MRIYANWKKFAEVCSYDILLENLIFKWNMISSFAGLSGGFIFFVIIQPNGVLSPTDMDAAVALQISSFLLITAFSLCYTAVTISLVLSSVFGHYMMHDKQQSREFQELREKSLIASFDKFQWMFDLPMTLSVVGIFCIIASLIFILMNQGYSWLWIYAASLFAVLAVIGLGSTMSLNSHLNEWMAEATNLNPGPLTT